MLDIKFLRENPEVVKQNIRNKFQDQKLELVDQKLRKSDRIHIYMVNLTHRKRKALMTKSQPPKENQHKPQHIPASFRRNISLR